MNDDKPRDQFHTVKLILVTQANRRSLLAVLRSWRWTILAFLLGGAVSRVVEWYYFR